jgi:hypothetical protein
VLAGVDQRGGIDRVKRLRPILALASCLLLLGGLLPATVSAATVWRFNLYRPAAFLYQDPYYTACTAAATMTMLNIVDLNDTGGNGFRWTTYRTKNSADKLNVRDMTSVLSFARRYDTLSAGRPGSDPHGWRNALNYYGWGWGSMTNPDLRVYDDRAFGTFDLALKAAVIAIARHRMPVGVLAWAGGHAQIATGYVVTGENPMTSDNFVVNGLWLSDPLHSSRIVNRYINRWSLKTGDTLYRFQAYREVDSPLDDPYTAGFRRSSIRSTASEWYRRWVLIVPTKDGLPEATPTPTPSPTPTPTPSPTAPPSGTPTPPPSATPTPAPTATPTPSPTASPSPSPTASPPPTPSPTTPASPSGPASPAAASPSTPA